MCLSLFLQCSRYYLKAKHYQKHLVANELAALICLQLKAVQIHLAASLQEQNALRHPHGDKSHGIEDDCSDSFLQGLGDANALDVVPAKAAVFGVSGTALGETSGDTGLFALQTSSGVGNDGNGCEDHDEPQQQQQNVGEAGAVAHNGHGLSLGPAGDPFVVINLESAEVEVFVEYHHDFITSFQVVNAYKHTHGEALHRTWPRALYRQVVLLGNSSYLQSFLLHLPLTKECLENTILLHINEPCPEEFPARSSRMKSFLREGVPNLETRYQLAKQLGPLFTDISMETASLVYMA